MIPKQRVIERDHQLPTTHPAAIEFVAELSYGGLIGLANMPPEDGDEVISVECPPILYPFAGTTLADLNSDANFAPIALVSVNSARLRQQRRLQGPHGGTL